MDPEHEITIEIRDAPNKRRRILVAVVVLVVLVAMAFAVRPVGRAVKAWHARRLAAQAETALAQKDWLTAKQKAAGAFVMSPFEPAVLRAMAHLQASETNAQALQYWAMLEQGGHSTPTDRQEAATLALRTGVLSVAVDDVNRLLADAPKAPTNLWLAAQLFAAANDRSNTLVYAGRAVAADPANRRYQLFLWSVRSSDPDPDARARARSALFDLAAGSDDIAWLAVTFLAEQPDLAEADMQKLIPLATNHPHPGDDARLVRLEIHLRLQPELRTRLLDGLVDQSRSDPPGPRRVISVWLIQHGESRRALELLPLEEAQHNRDLFLVCVDAYAAMQRWADLQELLAGYTPLEPVYAEAFQARCAKQLGQSDVAKLHWESSFNATRQNPEQMPWLADYAMLNGAADTAKRALRELARSAANKRAVYTALLNVTEKSGDTEELQALLGEMLTRWPDDPALRNDFAYLGALLGQDLPVQQKTAEELIAKTPDLLAPRTTLALALFRQKDFPGALKVYGGHKYDWSLALPSQRAVFAAVLAQNGHTPEARSLAHSIGSGQLRPEETELLRSFR